MLEALTVFQAEFGHADVPRSYRTAEGLNLGTWLHRQRVLCRRGDLDGERHAHLERVGVRWLLSIDSSVGLEAFAQFVRERGHGLVPHDHITASGFPLGVWVQSRRHQYAEDPRAAERLWPTLAANGFVWQVRDVDAEWVAGLRALTDYRARHGDVLVPHWYTTADGLALGRWLDSRRVERRNDTLAADRVQELEALGVVWRLRSPYDDPARREREDAHFSRMLGVTGRWVADHGCLPPARASSPDGLAVGRWLVRQRRLLRAGRLDPARLSDLDTVVGGWRRRT